MALRRILQLGDPLLRQVSKPVEATEDALPVLLDLRDTLHEFQRNHGFGRGIAAVQIGEPVRVIYIELGQRAYSLINPEILSSSPETFELWDDCFSFPQLMVRVMRAETIRVRYLDEQGRSQTLETGHAFAELLQHEIDHLDGILALDRATGLHALCTREEYIRRYQAVA